MIIRNLTLPIRASSISVSLTTQCPRQLHYSIPLRPVPQPTPFVPDAETFLKLIGRDLAKHTSKFESWDSLFTLSSQQLQEIGIEPARSRRYLLRWREKFRNGVYGVGGELQHVTDGVAEVKVVEIAVPADVQSEYARNATATKGPNAVKAVVNIPAGTDAADSAALAKAPRVPFLQIRKGTMLAGPHVQLLPGSEGTRGKIEAKEGLWEDRRGEKMDGGERRRAEVRAKKLSKKNKHLREKAGLK